MSTSWSASEWQLLMEASDSYEKATVLLGKVTRHIRNGEVVEASPLMKQLRDELKTAGTNVTLAHRMKEEV